MINDLPIIFSWWFLFFSLGIISLPLTWFFFHNFFDTGYSFSKIIGVLLLSYLVWLLGSLRIFSFSVSTIWLVLIILATGNFLVFRKNKKEFLKTINTSFKIIIFEEIIFFLGLLAWALVRGFQPDIEGLEKFMDFGFVNSILRSSYFPPNDIWMSGQTINYYYFGHLITAVLTKISNIDSAITYNLMIASLFSLTFTATFSLSGNLFFHVSKNFRASVVAGFLSALILTLGGNLHTLYWFLTNHFSFSNYWYPDATRFIVEKFGAADNTIHEFPIYSFVVSDLHGHVSDIPFVFLTLALIFSFLESGFNIFLLAFLSLLFGVLYMTNAWDFPIYFLIFGLAILYKNYLRCRSFFEFLVNSATTGFLIFIGSIIFILPFITHFSQIAQGVEFVHAHSPIWMLFVLWGFPWFIVSTFIVFLLLQKKKTIFLTDLFILIMILVATFLIIIPEFIYVKDIYISSYHRANTMFKLVYQSFMLYSLAGGYILIRIITNLKNLPSKLLLSTLYFLLSIFVLIYPYHAIKSYYGLENYRGLYGLNFLKTDSDLPAILWLQKNVDGQPVILEIAGDSYTQDNRVSALTGLPTVEGWLVHEWLWRGSFNEPGKRADEVKIIYESKDLTLTKSLLQKYQVKYVFIGTRERIKYQVLEDKFTALGQLVFENGNTKIFQIH
ncbi:MAG: DUF2298 domain-containing protein [bacterium]|nr:DUF2298 domain-containing protein [bacterium]